MRTENNLKDRCYRIKDNFLSSVFAKFGMNELYKIVFFLIHNKELYYFGFRLNESWFHKLMPDEQILLLDIYKFYSSKDTQC